MSIIASVPSESSAGAVQPHWPGAPQEELQLGRLEALLVNRSPDSSWWDALVDQIGRVTDTFRPHLAGSSRDPGAQPHGGQPAGRTAPGAARLEAEHAALVDELAELRALVAGSARKHGSVSHVLAASTEVIALLRGHNRRHRDANAGAGPVGP